MILLRDVTISWNKEARQDILKTVRKEYEKVYPYGRLGILTKTPQVAQRFSMWMTNLLNVYETHSPFEIKMQLDKLDYITSSKVAVTSLVEIL